MFVQTLSQSAQSLLEKLGRQRWMRNFYLAGGSGATLHLGHRISEDLDFFTQQDFNTKALIQRLKRVGDFELQTEAWGTVTGTLCSVRVSFFTYDYPLVEPMRRLLGVNVAGLTDIGFDENSRHRSKGKPKGFR